MGGYIGATAVGLTTTAADVQGDITSTDTTPELVLKNTSEEDSDGGREGKVTFKGEQTGGEESTLAQIEGRHEGTADDEKGELLFKTNDGSDGSSPTTALTINSEQKIGIGTTAPDNKLHVFESSTTQTASTESQLVLEKNSDSGITILSGQTSNGRILFGDSGDNDIGQIDYDHNDNSMSIVTNATEALKIGSDQRITMTRGDTLSEISMDSNRSSVDQSIGRYQFLWNGTLVAKIEGMAGPDTTNKDDGQLRFQTRESGSAIAERMRIDSSGNVLVGMTSNSVTGTGIGLVRDGTSHMYSGGTHTLELGRGTNDGDILKFNRSGTTVGSIGSNSSGGIYIQSQQNDAQGVLVGIRDQGGTGNLVLGATATSYGYIGDTSGSDVGVGFVSTRLQPINSATGASADNTYDIGIGSVRWDDIFATNGTINTSDEREKQNIASLTSAEITAATAISKLFKTYKWKDKVAAKGDAARTHTGVVAQQVETAMSDAGLDASKYAFWCSDTWWQVDGGEAYDTQEEAPEGATERNRKGIRYPELLAFIGAATEQRLTSIEARLDALEG